MNTNPVQQGRKAYGHVAFHMIHMWEKVPAEHKKTMIASLWQAVTGVWSMTLLWLVAKLQAFLDKSGNGQLNPAS